MGRAEEFALSQPQESGRPEATRRPASPLVDPSLVPLLTKSPTLRAGLAQADHDNLGVEWGPAGGGTYLVPGVKIVIDENAIGQGSRIARSLSHEVGHHHLHRATRSDVQAILCEHLAARRSSCHSQQCPGPA